ncbi:polyprenol monophosphomannose synthase [Fodinibius salsisoli]|uniref:Polyprenol monophosphomannose synthase n=1 Tax=Fodinibius salsisoli TaxID=2820877 RepID=A0ABT3PRZ4_9BACT|nr:polyprenol monophosphomannose synthase [Fodinibius salsisoli]MCW9708600.1 polyprenol monophosphomannose synthase [Fodinibius salsisoli]
MANSTLVIVPTYNESNNIRKLIKAVMSLDKVDLLIIDDGSPDGTAEIVTEEQEEYPDQLFLIERSGKLGLGTAYVRGFEYALEQNYTYICEMDADFSHNPDDLPHLIEEVKTGGCDVAIGSRYANGISIINWPLSRLILSYSANLYARFITGLPIFDTTAGFKCIHRKVLETISVESIRSNGYAFQIELHYRAWKAGFNLKEVAIIFREREEGVSKMSKGIMWEAAWRVWSLKIQSILGML